MFNRCFNTTQHVSNITKNDFESNIPIKPSDVFFVEAKIRVFFFIFYILQVLAEVMDPKSVVDVMLPVVISLAGDSVANVRFNVAKTLQKIAPVLDEK